MDMLCDHDCIPHVVLPLLHNGAASFYGGVTLKWATLLAAASRKTYSAVRECEAFHQLRERTLIHLSLSDRGPPKGLDTAWEWSELEEVISSCVDGRERGIEEVGRLIYFWQTRGGCLCSMAERGKLSSHMCEDNAVAFHLRQGFMRAMPWKGEMFNVLQNMLFRTFRLPGSSMKIDAVITQFSQLWYEENREDVGVCPFRNTDAVYILSYSLIMLNTDAYNDAVQSKMTMEQFVRAQTGINDGETLPREYLERCYESVVHDGGQLINEAWEVTAQCYTVEPCSSARASAITPDTEQKGGGGCHVS